VGTGQGEDGGLELPDFDFYGSRPSSNYNEITDPTPSLLELPLKTVQSLYRRWRHLVHELTRFGIVGMANAGLDFGLANLLHLGLGWSSLAAKTTSVTVAATTSFFMNRHWTFRHRARTRLRREYSLFFVVNGIGLLIADACILVVEQVFGKSSALWFNVAQLAGLALSTAFRFAAYKRFVFLSHERAAARLLVRGLQAEVSGTAGVSSSVNDSHPRPARPEPARGPSPSSPTARSPAPRPRDGPGRE
jgi:putative flippase GtrA